MSLIKILVLDAAQRSALAVTRSLGRMEAVAVYTAEASNQALAGCSKSSCGYFCCPNPQTEPMAFLAWLEALVSAESFQLVVPVTEITSQLLLMHAELVPSVRLPFAGLEQVMSLADKGRLVELAKRCAVPVPQSHWFANAQDLHPEEFTYPLIIKPCLSKLFVQGQWLATRVRLLKSVEDFRREIDASPYLLEHPFMLQEFVPGHGAGIFALYDRGRAVAFFAHERLREKPPEGGISVLSASAPIDPLAESYARKLLDASQWHGVAMVEFRVAPDGTYYLMEVNTRFWGSLQLSIDAGVDFPKLLVQAALGLPLQAPSHYRHGQRLRWLLGDFDSLYLYLRGNYSPWQKLKRVLDFVLPSRAPTRHEINRWNDLGPAWYELKLYFKQLLGR